MSEPEPIRYVTAADAGQAFVERWRGVRPRFWCVLGHTDICLLPGISTAGVSEELRPLTPAADAEVVTVGAALSLPGLPSSPLGPPGPSGITRAALRFGRIESQFVGAGLRVWPQTECLRVADPDSDLPGGDIQLGDALPNAAALFEAGLGLGRELAASTPWLVLGESVPGGTTTALALLLALGYAADGRVSGSMPGNAHELKSRVAHTALAAAGLAIGDGRARPMLATSKVGDPMQPLAAGIALGAQQAGSDVLLAGGSQMLAVAALLHALDPISGLERVAIGTTRWIAEDPAADVAGLAREISPGLPVLAVNLDFSGSRHPGLRQYEQFLVKEGVGAGGASIAALLASGCSLEQLHVEIDAAYDELLGKLSTSDSADPRRW